MHIYFFQIVKERTANRLHKEPSVQLCYFMQDSTLDSKKTGGGERDRTDDLLLAKQALSQLSYTPDT